MKLKLWKPIYKQGYDKNNMKKKFYTTLESFQGHGLEHKAKPTIKKTKVAAVIGCIIFGIGVSQTEINFGLILAIFGIIVITYSAILNGSLSERLKVWPYYDAVIDWQKVKEKKEEDEKA